MDRFFKRISLFSNRKKDYIHPAYMISPSQVDPKACKKLNAQANLLFNHMDDFSS